MDNQSISFFDAYRKNFRIRSLFCNIYLHLLLIMIVGYYCLRCHPSQIFNGTDGIRHLIFANLEWQWMDHKLYQGMNIFEGMGNVFYGFNFIMSPVFFIQLLLKNHVYTIGSYLLYSLLIFLSAYLLAQLYGFSRIFSITSGWILTLATMPFIPYPLLSTEFYFMPQAIDALFCSILLIYIFEKIGKNKIIFSITYSITIAFISYYLSAIFTFFVIICIPVIVIYLIFLMFISKSKYELFFKIGASFFVICCLLIMRVPQFLWNMQNYTAFHFFMREMPQFSINLSNTSILFEYAQGKTYPLWFIFSIIGALLAYRSTSKRRQFALLHILLVSTITFLGLSIYYASRYFNWSGSCGYYFEIFIWPSYVIYTAFSIQKFLELIQHLLKKIFKIIYKYLIYGKEILIIYKNIEKTRTIYLLKIPSTKRRLSYSLSSHIFIFLLPCLALMLNYKTTDQFNSSTNKHYNSVKSYPPTPTSITNLLAKQVGITRENRQFKGYEATFTPAAPPTQGISWFDQTPFDNRVIEIFGNDHRLNGLWYYNIPILNEYTQLITPPMYLLATRLLSRPIDKTFRTVIAYTKPNIPLLRMLGVRFIITNSPKKTFINASDEQYVSLRKKEFIDQQNQYLYLYELKNSNTANYSPVHFVVKSDAQAIIKLMGKGNFDYTTTAIVSKQVPENLVPAQNAKMILENGGVEIKASSPSMSSLLLPLQYSHCFHTYFLKKNEYFSIQRANLVETLLIFSGRLHIKLKFKLGPLQYANCRALDVTDMKNLKIQENIRYSKPTKNDKL